MNTDYIDPLIFAQIFSMGMKPIDYCNYCEFCGNELVESRVYVSGWKYDISDGSKYKEYRIRKTCPLYDQKRGRHTDGIIALRPWLFQENEDEQGIKSQPQGIKSQLEQQNKKDCCPYCGKLCNKCGCGWMQQ